MAPLVSVVMSVFNGERYLRKAMESILNQTFSDFEFIVIDDGSTDETGAILNSYNDPRLRLVRNERNIGVIKSLNKGLALAQGVYIARMDADDVSFSERLAKQVDFLETHPNIGVLGTAVQIIDGCGNISETLLFPSKHAFLSWCLCFFCPIAHPTVMMRRQIVERVGGYNSDMMRAEDYDLWRRLIDITRFSNLQVVLLCLRKHGANVSNLDNLEQRRCDVRVSSLMISHVLNEEVPTEIIQHLWDREFQTVYDVRQSAKLVYRVYRAATSNKELSVSERRIIRRDAARRLCSIIRPWVHNANTWGILAQAHYLDPFVELRFVIGRLRHVFSIWLGSKSN